MQVVLRRQKQRPIADIRLLASAVGIVERSLSRRAVGLLPKADAWYETHPEHEHAHVSDMSRCLTPPSYRRADNFPDFISTIFRYFPSPRPFRDPTCKHGAGFPQLLYDSEWCRGHRKAYGGLPGTPTLVCDSRSGQFMTLTCRTSLTHSALTGSYTAEQPPIGDKPAPVRLSARYESTFRTDVDQHLFFWDSASQSVKNKLFGWCNSGVRPRGCPALRTHGSSDCPAGSPPTFHQS